jgi:hypothetical protein
MSYALLTRPPRKEDPLMPSIKPNHAVLPKGGGGLAAIAAQLVAEGNNRAPKRMRAVLAIVDCANVNVNSDTGEEVATVRFRRIEVLLPSDLPVAEQLIRRAMEVNSGMPQVDLELEDEIRQAFEQMTDPGEDDAAAA